MDEVTLIVVKPDGVERRLVGEILGRFERAGLSIVEARMLNADPKLIDQHYPSTAKWLSTVGEKTLGDYARLGISAEKEMGTSKPEEIGKIVKGWLIEFMCSGPVFAAVISGNDAVRIVRKLCGPTLPSEADPGTIRGAFSTDTPARANFERRPLRNLIHASGNAEEAAFEIGLWFPRRGSG